MDILQDGSTGRSVRALQQALTDAGYELEVDGDFGAETERAVRKFQRANELEVDGVVGAATWEALEASAEDEDEEEDEDEDEDEDGEDEVDMPTIERGARGAAVVSLQQALVGLDYELEVDGDFGAATERAVRKFQRASELEVDGIVGSETWQALLAEE
jgi:peptidoglycan hydrolase-like protein with peptidoglycan-binding domain